METNKKILGKINTQRCSVTLRPRKYFMSCSYAYIYSILKYNMI
jgi:hypothetical protein